MVFVDCATCGHPSYQHVHATVKNMTTHCFHTQEWEKCNCKKFSK